MAHIKCKYYKHCCYFHGGACPCDSNGDEQRNSCEDFEDEYYNEAGVLTISEWCLHYGAYKAQFEKDIKNYEYDGGDLRMRGMSIAADDIVYLEIDGEVLEGGEV